MNERIRCRKKKGKEVKKEAKEEEREGYKDKGGRIDKREERRSTEQRER